VLRACRRLLRPGGRVAFTTIELAEGLSATQRRQAREAAPRAAAIRSPYPALLTSAGFTDIRHRDLTGEYLATARDWLHHSLPHRDALIAVDGAQQVNERLQGWRNAVSALEAGWLRRTLHAARRPLPAAGRRVLVETAGSGPG
jgi:hypothetical protein